MDTALRAALGQHYAPLVAGTAPDDETGADADADSADFRTAMEDFRTTMGAVPTAVSVVTTEHADGVWGMTVGSLTSLSLDPPLLLICLSHGSTTLGLLARQGRFAISVLAADQQAVADTFARPRDRATAPDRFDVLDGLPVIPAAAAWLTCRHRHTYRAGDHTIVVGAVRHVRHTVAEPLVRHASRYRRLA
jgi:3-hydroxy-9,10-secoandrosta-1,3,5(10)-triene-9,17-dione monooxygenase reductase component